MFKKIFNNLSLGYIDAYEEYKLPYIIKNSEKLSGRFKFLGGFFKFINKVGLGSFMVWMLKITKLYPSLWYIVSKK
jgi:hypothetical protein